MSKKIEFTEKKIKEIIKLYNDEMLGTPSIGKIFNVDKSVINRVLKENNISLGISGRKFTGGRQIAQKRYYTKPDIKEKKSNYSKKWSKENREGLREYHTKWRDENREHIREYGRNYERERRANDPKYRLTARTRTALYTCLKEANVAKYRSTFDILGYTIEELMNHLEKQFINDMTWDNYGEWHVDHIKAIALFTFTTTEDGEFKECWKLNNLQPLWGPENLSKGTKILY